MRKILIYIICLLGCTPVHTVYAQETKGKIEVLGYATEEAILLRWGPTESVGWNLLNKYGYTIERHTILKGTSLVDPIIKEVLSRIIKPASLNIWKLEADTNDYAAIAAQAIYGEQFNVRTGNPNDNLLTLINQSREQNQRFSFALYAADQSWKIAQLSGLAFKDSTVLPDEKYLYKIYGNVPQQLQEIDTGYVYIGLQDVAPLPIPQEFSAKFKSETTELSWDVEALGHIYNSYIIERSVDGGDFQPISEEAFVLVGSSAKLIGDRMVKIDSFPSEGEEVSYRIKGKSSFGMDGPFSKVITGTRVPEFDLSLNIISGVIKENTSILVKWNIEGVYNEAYDFLLERSDAENGEYRHINYQPILSVQNWFLDESPGITNYYRVTAISTTGQKSTSFPYLIQLQDSIPPESPQMLAGSIDSLGNVMIGWSENSEKDLSGYRVFRSNFKSNEFSQVTTSTLKEAEFEEKVTTKSLSLNLYYYVTAVDIRNNQSNPSEVILIRRPDNIAPVSPVMVDYKVNQSVFELNWINSSSLDVAEHLVYRKDEKANDWQLIGNLSIDAHQQGVWYDSTLSNNGIYRYEVQARDSSNNLSKITKPIVIDYQGPEQMVHLTNFEVKTDRKNKHIELSWDVQLTEKGTVNIYRSINDGPMSSFITVAINEKSVRDYKVEANNRYTYGIKIVMERFHSRELKILKSLKY